MRYIPATDDDLRSMMEAAGLGSLDEIFGVIPSGIREKAGLDLPPALSELELKRHMERLSCRNSEGEGTTTFLGAGTYRHFIPSAVGHILSRSEFYTAYTPYQPEISQGTLQAIFEFQTMICGITGMDVANASMYDGASALAEAVLMACRIKRKAKKVYVSGAVHPEYRDVVKTYTRDLDIEIVEIPFTERGETDMEWLTGRLDGETAAVAVQYPNFFGVIENIGEISERVKEAGALFITVTTEPVALGILKPPGEFGADIVVGEGQALGNPVGFGGPHLGLFASREEFVRNMPGRLVGETVDAEGKRGYVLTLSTREQHIRRERATSNICSNQSLCALAAAVYLSLLGSEGFSRLATINLSLAEYAKKRLTEDAGLLLRFDTPTFNEFVFRMKEPPEKVNARLLEEGIIGGLPLERFYPELSESMLFCVTEMHTRKDIDRLVEILGR